MQCEVIHCLVLVLLAVLASYLGWSKTCVGLSLKVQLYLEEDLTQPYQCRPLTLSKFSMLAQLCVQAWHPLWQMFLFICGEEARILQRRVSAMSSGYLFTLVCKFIVVYEPGMRTGIPQQWEHHDSRGGGFDVVQGLCFDSWVIMWLLVCQGTYRGAIHAVVSFVSSLIGSCEVLPTCFFSFFFLHCEPEL